MAKKPESNITKKDRRLSILFLVLSLMVTLAPILIYAVIAFVQGTVREKLTLGITLIIAIGLTVINIIFKFHIRSILWIMVLGIYFCIDNIMPLLLIVAIGTILDEFILTPLHKKFRAQAKINSEIDKRLE